IFRALFPDTVVVVGDVHFLQAFIVPVIPVHGTVEDIGVIGGTQVVCGGNRRVVTEVRSPAYPALAGVVAPAVTRVDDLVQGFVNQDRTTSQAGWRLGERQIVEDHVIEI